MATKPKADAKAKQALASDIHLTIEAQTAAFLQRGGEIQRIPNGVSGQILTTGTRHITIAKTPRQ